MVVENNNHNPPFNFREGKRYLPHILLIGLGIGTANFVMNGELNWLQWVIQSLFTSLVIGYTLIIAAINKVWLENLFPTTWKRYFLLFGIFFVAGMIATEGEQFMRSVVFSNQGYQAFTGGKMYVFNGILSTILGFSFFQHKYYFANAVLEKETLVEPTPEENSTAEVLSSIDKIPVKQGDTILLIPTADIVYFEAFDNYSFVFDVKGEKRLCDYSLLFLQKRLGGDFLRIHRKYIINSAQVKQVKSYGDARYLIFFGVKKMDPIISSKSYSKVVRSLTKIE